MKNEPKKQYVAPELEDLGSVAELTLGSRFAFALDSDWSGGQLLGKPGKPGGPGFS